jgi:hypothetical protein
MEKQRGELELTRGYLYLRPRPSLLRGRLESKQEPVEVLDDVALLLTDSIDSKKGSASCTVPPLTPPQLGAVQLLPHVPEPSAAVLGLAEGVGITTDGRSSRFLHVNGHKCWCCTKSTRICSKSARHIWSNVSVQYINCDWIESY